MPAATAKKAVAQSAEQCAPDVEIVERGAGQRRAPLSQAQFEAQIEQLWLRVAGEEAGSQPALRGGGDE